MGAEQDERRIQHETRGYAPKGRGQFGGRCFTVVGVNDELNQGIQLDAVEPFARRVPHHRDAVFESSGVEMGQLDLGRITVVAETGQPRDVGDSPGQLQHPCPVAADEQRHGHTGVGDEFARIGPHAVVRAIDVDGLAGKQRPNHVHGFDQSVDPRSRGVKPEPRGVVFGFHVPGPESQLEAPTGDRGDGGGLACGVDGMAQVVVQHQGSGAQSRCGDRCGGRACERRQRCDQMIGDGQHVKTGVLHRVCECAEFGASG
jgi:hypothetical protein